MATKLGGYAGKIMSIDLSSRKTAEYPWTDEDRARYLGGKIIGGSWEDLVRQRVLMPLGMANYEIHFGGGP